MSDNSMMGQVAIVTGAARGFGLAISERLMQRGVRVFGWDQEPSPIVGDKRFLGVATDRRHQPGCDSISCRVGTGNGGADPYPGQQCGNQRSPGTS